MLQDLQRLKQNWKSQASHLLIKTETQLGDAALDLVKLTAHLPSVSLDNVHGSRFYWVAAVDLVLETSELFWNEIIMMVKWVWCCLVSALCTKNIQMHSKAMTRRAIFISRPRQIF